MVLIIPEIIWTNLNDLARLNAPQNYTCPGAKRSQSLVLWCSYDTVHGNF